MHKLRCYSCKTQIDRVAQRCPSCNAIQILNGVYRIISILGQGGFGYVYEVQDTRMWNRPYAIKEILERPPYITKDAITQEAHALLNSSRGLKFMPDIYYYWAEGDKHYIVMTYIDGKTIDTIRRGPWPPDDVQRFTVELLGHLAQLHSRGIVHRDIKPTNIKLSADSGYVLLDFGLASIHGNTMVPGLSPDYAPIEQFREKRPPGSRTGPWSDLYSLAATSYYLLTGRKPMSADRRLDGHVLQPIPRTDGLAPQFHELLLKMLELRPENRPASAAEALASLGGQPPVLISLPPSSQRDPEETTQSDRLHTPLLPPPPRTPQSPTLHNLPRSVGATVAGSKGLLTCIAWSPHGHQLAVASAIGFAIYNVLAQQEVVSRAMPLPIHQIAYTLSGNSLALVTSEGVRIEHPAGTMLPITLHCYPSGDAAAVSSAPEHQLLAVLSDQQVALWDVQRRSVAYTLPERRVTHIALTPDGTRLALAGYGTVAVWQLQPGEPRQLRSHSFHPALAVDLAVSRDGRTLAVASLNDVRVWGQRGEQRFQAPGSEQVEGIALSQAGDWLAMVSSGGLAIECLVPLRPGRRQLLDPGSGVIGAEFSADGQLLCAYASDQLWVWRIADDALVFREDHGYQDSVYSLSFSPDGRLLAAMGGSIRLWEVAEDRLQELRVLEGHGSKQNGLAFDPSGEVLVSASSDHLKLWHSGDGTLLYEFQDRPAQAHGVAFVEGGQMLLYVGRDAIERWSMRDRAPAGRLPTVLGDSDGVVFSSGESILAIMRGSMVEVWSSDGTRRQTLSFSRDVHTAALSPDGQMLAVATEEDVLVQMVGARQAMGARAQAGVDRIMFAPDGSALALLCDKSILIWDLVHGALHPRQELHGHNAAVNHAAFAPGGRLLASASQDGTVRLWTLTEVGNARAVVG